MSSKNPHALPPDVMAALSDHIDKIEDAILTAEGLFRTLNLMSPEIGMTKASYCAGAFYAQLRAGGRAARDALDGIQAILPLFSHHKPEGGHHAV